ncbi:hypothetical protein C6P46_005532 [Rhodotorula mucilaginosa]|jgi:hypothetical protein|uniref:Uncharacterized protein n=1 Tax=Rhodotorula mucilaginosa TaxID=5537 RepID=A0A9P7B4B6_RHOMI|nr:hypothetical protein C6P46_005532 [Rhodotorula mucilaginosa]
MLKAAASSVQRTLQTFSNPDYYDYILSLLPADTPVDSGANYMTRCARPTILPTPLVRAAQVLLPVLMLLLLLPLLPFSAPTRMSLAAPPPPPPPALLLVDASA